MFENTITVQLYLSFMFISGKTSKQGQVYFQDVSAWWFSHFSIKKPTGYCRCKIISREGSLITVDVCETVLLRHTESFWNEQDVYTCGMWQQWLSLETCSAISLLYCNPSLNNLLKNDQISITLCILYWSINKVLVLCNISVYV